MTAFNLASIQDWLDGVLGLYLQDLAGLTAIDSGTYDKEGVDRVARILARMYRDLDAEVDLLAQPQYGDFVLARLSGTGSARLLLLGHTDTVYPAGTAAERPLRREGDRLFGPGAADMKSGDLAIVYALRALQAFGRQPYREVLVLHNSEEEVGSPASRDLIRELALASDAVFVLEAGRPNGDIVSARKGIAAMTLEVHGLAAHAGVNHDAGRSAALALAHLIVELEGLNGVWEGVTLNVGQVEVPGRPNVVPDQALARLEVRAPGEELLTGAIRRVEQIAAASPVEGTTAELTVRTEHHPMQRSAATAALVKRAQAIASDLGFTVSDAATGGASDGNTAALAGRPVLDGLGPIGGDAHSPGEYLLASSIVPRVALLAGMIAEVGTNGVID